MPSRVTTRYFYRHPQSSLRHRVAPGLVNFTNRISRSRFEQLFQKSVHSASKTLAVGLLLLLIIAARWHFEGVNELSPKNLAVLTVIYGYPKYINGTATFISNEIDTDINHSPDSYVWLRASIQGNTLRMKLYKQLCRRLLYSLW